MAINEQHSQFVLGASMALLSGFSQPERPLGKVPVTVLSVYQVVAAFILFVDISRAGGLNKCRHLI